MNKETTPSFALTKQSYIILIVGVVLIAIGFLLMIGGGADNPKDFNPELFNTQRITVAPITVLLGFATVLFALLKTPKE